MYGDYMFPYVEKWELKIFFEYYCTFDATISDVFHNSTFYDIKIKRPVLKKLTGIDLPLNLRRLQS